MKPQVEFDLMHLSPEVRKALEQCAPDYLSLSLEDREAQRAAWALSGNDAIRGHLLRHALGKTPEEISAIDNGDLDLSDSETHQVNTFSQQVEGVGEDFFSWNEYLPGDQTALSFRTVGDYDRALHDWQERVRADEDINSDAQVCRDALRGEWVRYLEKGELRYGSLCSRTGFIVAALERIGLDLLMELVPFEYIEGPNHGVPAGEGLITLDFRLRAQGFEALYRALSKAIFDLEQERREELLAEQSDDREVAVWIINDEEWFNDAEPNYTHIVFASAAAMDEVRTKFLLADCDAISGDMADLRSIFDKEISQFTSAVNAAHAKLRKIYTRGSVVNKTQLSTEQSFSDRSSGSS